MDTATLTAVAAPSRDDPMRTYAYGLIGSVVRRLVPDATRTAGREWTLVPHRQGDAHWLRLTVGPCQAAVAVWSGDGDLCLWLHVAASHVDGVLSSDALQERGIERHADELLTFADDRAKFCCPDLASARWFLDQPAVIAAGLALNSRLAACSPVAFHDPAVAVEAWEAASALAALPPVPVNLPTAGRFAGWPEREEHERLLRLLVCQLAEAGLEAEEPSDPPVDVAWWRDEDTYVVAEVAPVADGATAEAERLRLGLGRVLEFRHRMAARRPNVDAVLLAAHVDDPSWFDICTAAGVRLLAATDAKSWALR